MAVNTHHAPPLLLCNQSGLQEMQWKIRAQRIRSNPEQHAIQSALSIQALSLSGADSSMLRVQGAEMLTAMDNLERLEPGGQQGDWAILGIASLSLLQSPEIWIPNKPDSNQPSLSSQLETWISSEGRALAAAIAMRCGVGSSLLLQPHGNLGWRAIPSTRWRGGEAWLPDPRPLELLAQKADGSWLEAIWARLLRDHLIQAEQDGANRIQRQAWAIRVTAWLCHPSSRASQRLLEQADYIRHSQGRPAGELIAARNEAVNGKAWFTAAGIAGPPRWQPAPLSVESGQIDRGARS